MRAALEGRTLGMEWRNWRAALVLSALLGDSRAANSSVVVHTTPPPASCPVRNCLPKQPLGAAALAVPTGPPVALPEPTFFPRPCGTPGQPYCGYKRAFDVTYKPGHFVCTGCDVSACEGCSIICDLTLCVGEFFTQECWCQEGETAAPQRVFCDSSCSGGVCDTKGLTCRRREDACKPWWWCGVAPPVRPTPKPRPPEESLLQERLEWHRDARTRHGHHGGLRRGGSALALRAEQSRQPPSPGENDIDHYDFRRGRFLCGSAALPPRAEDPATGELMERGYIILDRRSCVGSLYNSQCYCYDAFQYLRGDKPTASELWCDAACKWGPCDGRTCASEPPTQLTPAPFTPPVFEDTRRHVDMVMEPLDKSVLRR